MIAALWLADNELAADQLDGLAVEHPNIHEPFVLGPLPPPERERSLRHARPPVARCGSITATMTLRYRDVIALSTEPFRYSERVPLELADDEWT